MARANLPRELRDEGEKKDAELGRIFLRITWQGGPRTDRHKWSYNPPKMAKMLNHKLVFISPIVRTQSHLLLGNLAALLFSYIH